MKQIVTLLFAMLMASVAMANGNIATENELTPSPTVTFYDCDDCVNIMVEGSGYLYVEILVNDELMESIEGYEVLSYSIWRDYEDKEIKVVAMATMEGYEPSEVVMSYYYLTSMPIPEAVPPCISYMVEEDVVLIYAEGEDLVHLIIDGLEVAEAPQYVTYIVDRGDNDYEICAQAWTENEYGSTSEWVEATIIVPAIPHVLEKTDAPAIFAERQSETSYYVMIENSDMDPYASIYYRVEDYVAEGEWLPYTGPFVIEGFGTYIIEAYAWADGKDQSDVVTYCFVIEPETEISQVYDFVVDGIYYSKERCPEGEVWVSTEYMAFRTEWVLPHAYSQCYHGDVVIPSSVEYEGQTYTVTGIGENAFEKCDVSSVTLPNTITTLYHGAFWGADLKQIIIPASVTFIGDFAFDCPNLTKIVCMGTTPSHVTDGYMWLMGINERATLFVPLESLEAYRTHDVWHWFAHIVPFIGAGPGDVDGDGIVGIDDVTNLIDQLLNGGELPAYIDVDGDGTVDINDVTALIDMLLGIS